MSALTGARGTSRDPDLNLLEPRGVDCFERTEKLLLESISMDRDELAPTSLAASIEDERALVLGPSWFAVSGRTKSGVLSSGLKRS